MSQHYPVIILGAGPAGVSAALTFKEAEIQALLIEQQPTCGGQLAAIPSAITNFALGWFASGAEAQLQLQTVLAKSNIAMLQAQVHEVRSQKVNGETFLPTLLTLECTIGNVAEKAKLSCDYLMVATGLSENKLSLSPIDLNAKVKYHIDQDLQNKRLAIVGGGDSALLKAIKLADQAKKIFVIHRREKFNARPDLSKAVAKLSNVEILLSSEIIALDGDGKIESITVTSAGALINFKVDIVLAKVGYVPNSAAFAKVLALDKHGYIVIDSLFKTSHQHIFAAGDITAGTVPRIGTAVGQGLACAASMIAEINGLRP